MNAVAASAGLSQVTQTTSRVEGLEVEMTGGTFGPCAVGIIQNGTPLALVALWESMPSLNCY